MKLDHQEIASRLKLLIEESGKSHYRIAKDTGISASTISNYVNNKTNPDRIKLNNLCEYLGASVNWVLHGEEPKYLLKETETTYRKTSIISNDKEWINMVDKLTDMLREKDYQITELIKKLPDYNLGKK